MKIDRVGGFRLGWGESLLWDDAAERLYFVDCVARTLHWLDGASGDLGTLELPSMVTGIVPADDGTLVGVLDDGLYVIDQEAGSYRLLAGYPPELGGRGNDACADLAGNLITGKLNLGPAEGSAWWYSSRLGWRLIDPDISNTNGPAAGIINGAMTLIVGDTSANYYAYPYQEEEGLVGERSIFGDVGDLQGSPDGSTLDAEEGLWCALVGGGQLARFTSHGLDRTIALPVLNATDVAFGGADLDRLFVVSIGLGTESDDASLDGALLAIEGLGVRGRPEPRFRLSG
jgi:sugar lactone lactonase YvrE